MPEIKHPEASFITTIREVIEKNLSNSSFGVVELADEMRMSRSSLLRKVKKAKNISVSQFIRQVRLENNDGR